MTSMLPDLLSRGPLTAHSLQARAAVLTAAQCATYNEAKNAWMRVTGADDSLSTHVGASMISGLVTTTLTAPVDVIKTNMFCGEPAAAASPPTPEATLSCRKSLSLCPSVPVG